MLNIHGSLLPRWRGAAPLNYAILNNDLVTGITIMKVMPKKWDFIEIFISVFIYLLKIKFKLIFLRFDIGDIVMQREYKIPSRSTAKQLVRPLAQMGAQLVIIKC